MTSLNKFDKSPALRFTLFTWQGDQYTAIAQNDKYAILEGVHETAVTSKDGEQCTTGQVLTTGECDGTTLTYDGKTLIRYSMEPSAAVIGIHLLKHYHGLGV